MSTIITRNSATSGSSPSSLTQGELAINVTDNRLYFGSGSANTVREFGVTSSYALQALSASYAISASVEIIKEVSSSYADTASFAQSGNGTFSGSFSGSYEGDGSNLTGIDPFPFTGDAEITGSLTISGSFHSFTLDADNVVLGSGAGASLVTTSDKNVLIGVNAGDVVTGDDNVVIGHNAGGGLSTSNDNVIIGKEAGRTGNTDSCVFIGNHAGDSPSSAAQAIAIGDYAGRYATLGDVAIGYLAGGFSGGGANAGHNTSLGYNALYTIGPGAYANLGLGDSSGYSISSGDYNIAIGYKAGYNLTTGKGNIFIGSGSLGEAGISDQLRIGNGTSITTISASLLTGDIIFPSTASAAYFVGDGSNLTGVDPFPFTGDAVITGSLVVSASATSQSLSVQGSGSTVFDVIGSVGTLFSVDDDLTGTLFTANDISGFPVLEVSASGDVYIGKSPQSLYTTAVISSTTAATTHSLCTLSTSSYDGAFFEYTAQSASNARAGNIMSTWNGSNIVYAETTTIDIGSTSDLTTEVIISGSTARLVAYGANAGYKIKTTIKAI